MLGEGLYKDIRKRTLETRRHDQRGRQSPDTGEEFQEKDFAQLSNYAKKIRGTRAKKGQPRGLWWQSQITGI